MIDIKKYESDIFNICKEMRIKKLSIFGSATTNNFGPSSDIDIIIEFEHNDGDNLFDKYFELKQKLEDLFQRSVDVVMEKAVTNPFFKEQLEKSRIELYAA